MTPTVLIVDDEPMITIALKTRLEAHGFTVVHAVTGLKGVEEAERSAPDAVIMDVRMPDIDGFEACRRIRRLSGLETVPVVFVSGNVKEEAKRDAMDAGGARFFSKPYEASEVIGAIRELIEAGGVETRQAS